MDLANLDERTRRLMLGEIELDIANGNLYISPRLSTGGADEYPTLLREAAESHDDDWLAVQLRSRGAFNATYQRRKPTGGYSIASMPSNAPETLAEGEFNRFYMRGLCLRAIEDGVAELEVYRARESSHPRWESEALIGTRIDPARLLDDLRTHTGVDTALGLPPGPNSGLSVRLP